MPQPYFEMEESRSVTPWVNRLFFESPRASSFLGLRLVKRRPKNLVPLLSGVKPDPMVGSGRYAEPIPVKSPLIHYTDSDHIVGAAFEYWKLQNWKWNVGWYDKTPMIRLITMTPTLDNTQACLISIDCLYISIDHRSSGLWVNYISLLDDMGCNTCLGMPLHDGKLPGMSHILSKTGKWTRKYRHIGIIP